MINYLKSHYRAILLIMICLLGIVLRSYRIGTLPGEGAINQDEAMAGYEAWSLSQYRTDADGYTNPIYFVAWGSGMNALESYLMIPFIKLWGLNNITIRLPQMIIGILTLLSFYTFCKETGGWKRGLIGLFLLSVLPWHIMISRWALESNLFPAFLLFSETFLLKSKKKPAFLLLYALFMGFSLYTYSAAWVVLPFLVISSLLWILYQNKSILRVLPGVLVILFVLSLPLLLFILVNYGLISEICLPWISIPKMSFFRGNEISFHFHVLRERFRELIRILAYQTDGNSWNSLMPFGLYYFITIPLFFSGTISILFNLLKEKKLSPEWPVVSWFVLALLLGTLLDPNINRINIIHIPIIYIISVGLEALFKSRETYLKVSFIGTLLICCFSFFYNYESIYSYNFANQFFIGIKDAIHEVRTCEHIAFADNIPYVYPLFYETIPPSEYLATRKLSEEDTVFRKVSSFGKYSFQKIEQMTSENLLQYDGIIVPKGSQSDFARRILPPSFQEIDCNRLLVFKSTDPNLSE